ncbi:MAG: cobalamin-dependent protein [Phycisphaerales bacterium]|nr:MAG: cobalamin-dependent protein [Phycisphaerales bacterium]
MSRRPKKILFIHPLGVNWTPGERDMSRIANIMPPIGLCSLAAWLESHGHRADIHDCYAFPGRDDKIEESIRSYAPDFVGFSTTTSSFFDAVRIASRIKDAYPQLRTIFGGVHVSGVRHQLLRDYPGIDYGVVGEGEEALLAICERNGADLEDVPGILYRDGDAVVFTGLRKHSLDLDSLPFPAYGKLAGFPRAYTLPIFNYPKAPGTTVISSRGCVYQCSYCDRSVFRRSFRYNSAGYMVELLQHLHASFGIRHVNFYDDVFTLNRNRVVEFCERLARARLALTFNCAARAEHIDRDLLRLMKRSGCWMISLGIETGDPQLLARHRADADLEMIRERIQWIKQASIRAKGLFILGMPGETEATIERSIDFVLGLPISEFNLAKFTPFPGSPAYGDIHRHGQFDEQWELMNCLNFVFIPQGLSRERLEERYREFYRRYFQRLPVLLRYVAMLWYSPHSWLRFLLNLRDFLRLRRSYRKVAR